MNIANEPVSPSQKPSVELRGVSKSYSGVLVLSEVSLDIMPGEVHALMGENGAGKSTLIKCLSGVVTRDSGDVFFDGQLIPPGNIALAEAAGIAVIHQESVAFPDLSAQDNIFIGRELRRRAGLLLDKKRMESETRVLLERLGEDFDTRRPVGELSLAQRQMVGIARALSQKSRLLIMDEPTASLSARESQVLFRLVHQLRAEGISVLYVSHRMEEVFDLSDRVTVLRDGRKVETRAINEISPPELIRLMVGREIQELSRDGCHESPTGTEKLSVRGLSRSGQFRDVSFEVRAGEIVGLAGLVGAGRSEVAQTIFGIQAPDSGEIHIAGRLLHAGSVQDAIREGVALVPEDRQHQGLVLPLSIGTNLILTMIPKLARKGVRSLSRENELIARLMEELQVKATDTFAPSSTLSGGNQQKLVVGKWLATQPTVLILDEPTRGVDVGAKAEIYRLIRELAAGGMATLLISSDLTEVLALSDRVLVMRQGRISGELSRAAATQEAILALALPDAPPQLLQEVA